MIDDVERPESRELISAVREGEMFQGFKQFMLRGNVLDLAVALPR